MLIKAISRRVHITGLTSWTSSVDCALKWSQQQQLPASITAKGMVMKCKFRAD